MFSVIATEAAWTSEWIICMWSGRLMSNIFFPSFAWYLRRIVRQTENDENSRTRFKHVWKQLSEEMKRERRKKVDWNLFKDQCELICCDLSFNGRRKKKFVKNRRPQGIFGKKLSHEGVIGILLCFTFDFLSFWALGERLGGNFWGWSRDRIGKIVKYQLEEVR